MFAKRIRDESSLRLPVYRILPADGPPVEHGGKAKGAYGPMIRENLLITESSVEHEIGLLMLEGELIAETRYEPERILREWLDGGLNRVIIRCATLSYIDSAGLSTLLGALHRFRRQGGDLILSDMNPTLNAIFEVTSMEKYFKIFASIDAARAHFGQMAGQSKKRAGDAAQRPEEAE